MKNSTILTVVFVILTLYIVYAHTQQTLALGVQFEHFRDSTFIHDKGALSKERCESLINEALGIEFDTSGEPVDDEPVYQINVYSDGKILNHRLWKHCEEIYKTYREKDGYNDFMFLKRYRMNERNRMPPHSDSAAYTVSILLSDTGNFEGCSFYLFDKDFDNKVFQGEDVEAKHSLIDTMGGSLPLIDLKQGDVLRFDSEQIHGVTPLKAGERYLLTIFYDAKGEDEDEDEDVH